MAVADAKVDKRVYPVGESEYKLLEEVGRGVSAIVYRAKCIPFGDYVAIKTLDLERCNSNLVGHLFFPGHGWCILLCLLFVLFSFCICARTFVHIYNPIHTHIYAFDCINYVLALVLVSTSI